MLTKNIRSLKSKMGLIRASQASFHSSSAMNEVVSTHTLIEYLLDDR